MDVRRRAHTVRLVVFASPVGQARSVFYPEDEEAAIHLSDEEGFRFRLLDRVEDYWVGEPGADAL